MLSKYCNAGTISSTLHIRYHSLLSWGSKKEFELNCEFSLELEEVGRVERDTVSTVEDTYSV
jgi:hypothetical protein